jgi:hypothetical protein
VRQQFGDFIKDVARGLSVRHDHGSQYMSDVFQSELRFLGIESSPAFVRALEGNGCAERFIRTLKENLLWVRTFQTIEELRLARGGTTRMILLPASVWRSLVQLRGNAGLAAPVFRSAKGGNLDRTPLHRIVKTAAARAGLSPEISAHWLRHAHVSHALDRGAPPHLVQATVGHASLATVGGDEDPRVDGAGSLQQVHRRGIGRLKGSSPPSSGSSSFCLRG